MSPPRILAISSFVAYGSVGLRAIGPALEHLGCNAVQLPTVVLSNHPGHTHCAGQPLEPGLLRDMALTIDANGWFQNLDAIVSGYLPSATHVEAVRDAVTQARRRTPTAPFVLDPILGDDPRGLYVAETAADAIRKLLLPLADLITPNRFELEWLTGMPVTSVENAIAASRSLRLNAVVATSIPEPSDRLATVLVTPGEVVSLSLARRQHVPHGTGDLLAGLLAGHLAHGTAVAQAIRAAHASLEAVIEASTGCNLLDLSSLTDRSYLP